MEYTAAASRTRERISMLRDNPSRLASFRTRSYKGFSRTTCTLGFLVVIAPPYYSVPKVVNLFNPVFAGLFARVHSHARRISSDAPETAPSPRARQRSPG